MILKILAAGGGAGIVANVTGYRITGRLFHSFQAETPDTWRNGESWTVYTYSAVLELALVCLLASMAVAVAVAAG